jgi:hypothetical protein
MSLSPFIIGRFLSSTWPGQVLLVLFGGIWIAAAIASGSITQPRLSTMLALMIALYGGVKLVRRIRRR